jgi:type I restriction enzyme S subunit
MKYQRYPAYKASGVEWLGDVPEHWELTRVKFESYVKARVGWHGLKSDDFTDEGAYLITGQDFVGSNINWDNCYHCDFERYEQDPYIQLQEDDLLITKDGTIGKIALVKNLNGKATLNSGIFVVRPLTNSYTDKFYFWLLQSSVFTGFVDFNKTGSTIVHLYQDTFVNFKYAMPDFNEQQKIANFLDHETAKIDTLIEKQRRLIELLKEKRQAVISHAVTKGLNPNAPMKDSGVEWLGEVPEHWEVKPIKHLAELNPKKSEITLDKNLMCNFVPMEKLKIGAVLLDEVRVISDVYDGYTYFKNDDILMAKVTPCFENHNIAIVNELENNIGFGSTEIYVLRVKTGVVNNFLFYRLQESNFMAIATSAMTGAGGLKRVPSDVLSNYLMAIPNFEEQEKIASYIDEQATKIDNLIEKSNSAINLMQERRTALISAAVTGKIDVRHWESPNV